MPKKNYYATVTPLRKSESRNEPRKTIFAKLRGTRGYLVAVTGSGFALSGCYGVFVDITGSTSRSVSRKSFFVALAGQIYRGGSRILKYRGGRKR